MTVCPSCNGVIGRDCWNPEECAQITAQMHQDGAQPMTSAPTENREAIAKAYAEREGFTWTDERILMGGGQRGLRDRIAFLHMADEHLAINSALQPTQGEGSDYFKLTDAEHKSIDGLPFPLAMKVYRALVAAQGDPT